MNDEQFMAEGEVFPIRVGEIPARIHNEITEATKHYMLPVITNNIPLGSGTFVKIDEHFGILTAEHVVRPPGRPELDLTNIQHDGPTFFVPPAFHPGGRAIESYALRVITTNRQVDPYGPDLALVVLPPSPLLSELKARRSYVNLSVNPSGKLSAALEDTGFVPFCGFPACKRVPKTPVYGYRVAEELGGFAFITAPEKYEERDGWDYYELSVDRNEIIGFGDSFGGVSGGGIWRVPIYRRPGAQKGMEFIKNVTLAGVAFYEQNYLPNGRFFVRAHGPKSIYERFLPMIREKLR